MPLAAHTSPHRPSVRLLVMGWSLWLLAMWGWQWWRLGLGEAAVRGLVFAAAVGMLAVWPAVRLSQVGSLVGVVLDWVALNALWQMVVWPMVTMMRWPVEQAVWQSVALAGWSLWVGWIIAAAGLWRHGGVRAGAMAACVALLVGEPAAMAMLGRNWPAAVSPLGALWALTEPAGYFDVRPWSWRVMVTGTSAAVAWVGLVGARVLRGRPVR